MSLDRSPSRWGALPPVRLVRRVLAPAALELSDEVAALRAQVARMHELVGVLATENAELRQRVDGLLAAPPAASRAELSGVLDRVEELRDGLHEQRRLQLRVAEVTDVVTELVLPLHDRQIDPAVLGRLRPDTL